MNPRRPGSRPRKPMSVIGYAPDGHPFFEENQLPELARFEHVVIGKHSVAIDGWELPYRNLTLRLLRWIQRSVVAWNARHPEESEWMEAILHTLEERIAGEF